MKTEVMVLLIVIVSLIIDIFHRTCIHMDKLNRKNELLVLINTILEHKSISLICLFYIVIELYLLSMRLQPPP